MHARRTPEHRGHFLESTCRCIYCEVADQTFQLRRRHIRRSPLLRMNHFTSSDLVIEHLRAYSKSIPSAVRKAWPLSTNHRNTSN